MSRHDADFGDGNVAKAIVVEDLNGAPQCVERGERDVVRIVPDKRNAVANGCLYVMCVWDVCGVALCVD